MKILKLTFFMLLFFINSFTLLGQISVPIPYEGKVFLDPVVNDVYYPFSSEPVAGERAVTITVNYLGNWSPEAMAAFDFAVGIWEQTLTSSVDIEINATWADLNNPDLLGQAGPADGMADFNASHPVYQDGVVFPIALANKLAGQDLNPALHDINAEFNSGFTAWYFGTDGATPTTQIDFVTVVLHEIGHGMGFLSSANANATQGIYGIGNPALPLINDLFIVDGNGTRLTDFPIATVSNGLENFLTSQDLFFDGPESGDTRLFAPNPFRQGSSISHIDEDTYSMSANGLMTPFAAFGEANHNPGQIGVNYLNDIGWEAVLVTGLEDAVIIRGFDSGCYFEPQCPWGDTEDLLVGYGATNLVLGGTAYYAFEFIDNPPYSYPQIGTFDWTLEALTTNGENPMISECSTNECNEGWIYGALEVESIPNLPYKRDELNRIKAEVAVEGIDSDGTTHKEVKSVTIDYKPTFLQATISSTNFGTNCDEATFQFYASGAENYIITYNNSSFPFPISITIPSGQNSYTISDLDASQSYTFVISAINEFGYITKTFTRGICGIGDPYPNPFKESYYVVGPPSGISAIQVFDMNTNNLVQHQEFEIAPSEVLMDATGLAVGNYTLKVYGTNPGEIFTKLISKF